jgi:hypothetical protein
MKFFSSKYVKMSQSDYNFIQQEFKDLKRYKENDDKMFTLEEMNRDIKNKLAKSEERFQTLKSDYKELAAAYTNQIELERIYLKKIAILGDCKEYETVTRQNFSIYA